MAENIPKKMSIPDLAIGVAIGFILGYVVAKNTISGTTSIGPTNSLNSMNIGIRQLSNRLAIIEARLDIPSPYIQHQEQHQGQYQGPHQEIQLSDSSSSLSSMKQIMENEEDFTIKKDEKGRMCGAVTHRKLYSTEDSI